MLLSQIAEKYSIHCKQEGDIHSFAFLTDPVKYKRSLIFLSDRTYVKDIHEDVAGIITTEEIYQSDFLGRETPFGILIHSHPKWMFFTLFNQAEEMGLAGKIILEHKIHPDAKIHPTAVIEEPVHIEKGAEIGAYTLIRSQTVIGAGSTIGHHCVIGDDGFQYTPFDNDVLKVNHYGNVLIEEGVDIKNHVTIDRAVLSSSTVISQKTKIDAHTHIGHGCRVGKRNLIGAHSVLTGNVYLEDDCWVSAGTIIRNRLHIGNRVKTSLGAVVTKDLDDDMHVSGNFAVDHKDFIQSLKNRK